MHKLNELQENLIRKLGEYAGAEISGSNINAIDTLAHAAKNVGKIIEMCDEEDYSMRGGSYRRGSYDGGRSYDDRSYEGESYRRRRDAMGRYTSRDSGYSRDGGKFLDHLRALSEDAPDDRTREEIQRLIDKMGDR